MSNRNISLQISAYAYSCIEEVSDRDYSGKYKTLVKKLGQLILKNGLIQTLVFFQSKEKKEHDLLIKHLAEWWLQSPLLDFNLEINYSENKKIRTKNKKVIEKIVNLDSSKYKNCAKEGIKLSIWLARLADGMVADE
ncbi:type III-B CRISPR module-associated protein Cmr5 [Halanaerobium salsuginis]|jgi:CRISPR type III-B/RAMP module-associated protein Cmr5|nr:type III-B CRISPR module-associated protein Cmr5 [Halanaerobium salsuginis]